MRQGASALTDDAEQLAHRQSRQVTPSVRRRGPWHRPQPASAPGARLRHRAQLESSRSLTCSAGLRPKTSVGVAALSRCGDVRRQAIREDTRPTSATERTVLCAAQGAPAELAVAPRGRQSGAAARNPQRSASARRGCARPLSFQAAAQAASTSASCNPSVSCRRAHRGGGAIVPRLSTGAGPTAGRPIPQRQPGRTPCELERPSAATARASAPRERRQQTPGPWPYGPQQRCIWPCCAHDLLQERWSDSAWPQNG